MENNYKEYNSRITSILGWIVHLLIVVAAVYLAWDANKGGSALQKWIPIIFAAIFSYVYIIFYIIKYLILGNSPINNASTVLSAFNRTKTTIASTINNDGLPQYDDVVKQNPYQKI
jgi:hypothetical protein